MADIENDPDRSRIQRSGARHRRGGRLHDRPRRPGPRAAGGRDRRAGAVRDRRGAGHAPAQRPRFSRRRPRMVREPGGRERTRTTRRRTEDDEKRTRQSEPPAAMRYVSTRGAAPAQDFEGVLLAGLAEDGGLYVPGEWPHLSPADLRAMRGLPYPELAAACCTCSWANYRARDAAGALPRRLCRLRPPGGRPLVQLETGSGRSSCSTARRSPSRTWRCSCSAGCSTWCCAERGERITIVGATSGDTGSAAIEACRAAAQLDVVDPASRRAAPARCSAGR